MPATLNPQPTRNHERTQFTFGAGPGAEGSLPAGDRPALPGGPYQPGGRRKGRRAQDDRPPLAEFAAAGLCLAIRKGDHGNDRQTQRALRHDLPQGAGGPGPLAGRRGNSHGHRLRRRRFEKQAVTPHQDPGRQPRLADPRPGRPGCDRQAAEGDGNAGRGRKRGRKRRRTSRLDDNRTRSPARYV